MDILSFNSVILIIVIVVGFYMAWNIGANDVANAMGTSVGSGALTMKRAVIIAAILEFSGAFLVGSTVTDTVRKGIIDPQLFLGTPEILMFGMLGALLAAAVWLQIATYFGLPVSTTHSIIGAIIGFALVAGGSGAVAWPKVSKIVASWVVSPLMGGVISFFIFNFIKTKMLNVPNPIKATRRLSPYLVFSVFFILTLVMVFKGLKQLNLDLELGEALLMATVIGAITAIISYFLISWYLNQKKELDHNTLVKNENSIAISQKLEKVKRLITHSSVHADSDTLAKLDKITADVSSCLTDVKEKGYDKVQEEKSYQVVERVFIFLQILSACFVAFAHGANDVANAIGPMAAVISIIKTGTVIMKVPVPLWVLALGGVGIVIGLATWGWRVIETIGKKITELTPTRGFAAEFGAATTIVIASKLGLPISTTHTLVGSVLGVGMARGVASLNMIMVRNILMSWFITLPAGGFLSILFYYVFKSIFL